MDFFKPKKKEIPNYKLVLYATNIDEWKKDDCFNNCYVNKREMKMCACPGCYRFSLADMFTDKQQKQLKNYKNKHCITCCCENCVCTMRKLNKEFEEPRLANVECEYHDIACKEAVQSLIKLEELKKNRRRHKK